jgi:hypothetical protein
VTKNVRVKAAAERILRLVVGLSSPRFERGRTWSAFILASSQKGDNSKRPCRLDIHPVGARNEPPSQLELVA